MKPIDEFNGAVRELKDAFAAWRAEQADPIFMELFPDRRHWVRPAGPFEKTLEMYLRNLTLREGYEMYFAVMLDDQGRIHKRAIAGKPGDLCDYDEEASKAYWLKAVEKTRHIYQCH